MMNASELWQSLLNENPERLARVAHQIGDPVGSAQELIDQLSDLRTNTAIANERCGYIGNPYEKLAEDYVLLLAAAEQISGLCARFPWERQ
jgi:hypothetical protein